MTSSLSEGNSTSSSATDTLASFARSLSFEESPDQAVEMARKCIIDVIGVTIAGCNEPASERTKEFVESLGSSGETTVLGTSSQYAPPHAALINGVQGHALDYDDTTFYTFSLHPSVTIVPTLLAAGEMVGASGKELLSSYIAAFEVQIRITGGIGGVLQQMGYHPTGTVGVFGSTVAAGRLLNLTQNEFQHALGIASSLYSGIIDNYGTMTKPYHAGLANQNGMKAAMLAKEGFTANADILDEPYGPWLSVDEEYTIDEWCEDLGEEYYAAKGIGIKKYPSCACTHGGIDAAVRIHDRIERDVNSESVDQITVRAAQSARDQLKYDNPTTPMEAKFSMPYCVVSALLDGDINLNHFEEDNLDQVTVQELFSQTTFEADEQYANDEYISEGYPAQVSIEWADGTVEKESVFEPSGTPSTPISESALKEKFHECASYALEESTVDELYDTLHELEVVEDVGTITASVRE